MFEKTIQAQQNDIDSPRTEHNGSIFIPDEKRRSAVMESISLNDSVNAPPCDCTACGSCRCTPCK